jgi:hypothetical protein
MNSKLKIPSTLSSYELDDIIMSIVSYQKNPLIELKNLLIEHDVVYLKLLYITEVSRHPLTQADIYQILKLLDQIENEAKKGI